MTATRTGASPSTPLAIAQAPAPPCTLRLADAEARIAGIACAGVAFSAAPRPQP